MALTTAWDGRSLRPGNHPATLLPATTLVALLLGAAVGGAQVSPNGPQFQVNTYSTNEQERPDLTVDPQGNFVVVWMSFGSPESDSSSYSVQGQRFDTAGRPIASQFQVNSYTPRGQYSPSVDSDDQGDFVTSWGGYYSVGMDSRYSVQARRFDQSGSPLGEDFQVNSYTTNDQLLPDVLMNPKGDFVVAWSSYGSFGTDTSDSSIQARLYDSAGNPSGPEFQVNTYTPFSQYDVALAGDPRGGFLAAWTSVGSAGTDTSLKSVQARLYDVSGNPVGDQFQVNTYTTSGQYAPAVGRDAQGGFVVAWESYGSAGSDASQFSIQARRFDAAGTPLGPEFQVNSLTSGNQTYPAVAVAPKGDFVVAWEGYDDGGVEWAIQAQRFRADGAPLGGEFRVDSYDYGQEKRPQVASDLHGNFVVTWQSIGSVGMDTSSWSIQARRFDALFRDGFESGDTGRWSTVMPWGSDRPGIWPQSGPLSVLLEGTGRFSRFGFREGGRR